MTRASIYRERLVDRTTGRVRPSQTWYVQVTHDGKRYTRSARTLDKERAIAALRLLEEEVLRAQTDHAAASHVARTAEIETVDGQPLWRSRARGLARAALQRSGELGARAREGLLAMGRLGSQLKRSRLQYQPRAVEDQEGWQGYCLSQGEEQALLSASPPYLRDLLVFLLGTGAEVEEALALTWQHIVVEQGRAIVLLGQTETRPGRAVPLPDPVRELLVGLRMKATDLDAVFQGPQPRNGRRSALVNIAPAFRAARRKAKLRHLELRDLRYTYAARLVARGVDLKQAARLVGVPLHV